MYARFSTTARVSEPLWNLDLQRLTADEPLQRPDLRLVLLQEVYGLELVVERTPLVLRDPHADQVPGEIVAPGQSVEALAAEVFLRHLAL